MLLAMHTEYAGLLLAGCSGAAVCAGMTSASGVATGQVYVYWVR